MGSWLQGDIGDRKHPQLGFLVSTVKLHVRRALQGGVRG